MRHLIRGVYAISTLSLLFAAMFWESIGCSGPAVSKSRSLTVQTEVTLRLFKNMEAFKISQAVAERDRSLFASYGACDRGLFYPATAFRTSAVRSAVEFSFFPFFFLPYVVSQFSIETELPTFDSEPQRNCLISCGTQEVSCVLHLQAVRVRVRVVHCTTLCFEHFTQVDSATGPRQEEGPCNKRMVSMAVAYTVNNSLMT